MPESETPPSLRRTGNALAHPRLSLKNRMSPVSSTNWHEWKFFQSETKTFSFE
jgi:hypothetical protein